MTVNFVSSRCQISCENVCRDAVELTCKKRRHLCCKYCLTKYFEVHGNRCPVHPEHSNLKFTGSRFTRYHIETLRVRCPYSTASGSLHAGCGWTGELKHLDEHLAEHRQFVRCPFAEYGCTSKLRIDDKEDQNGPNGSNQGDIGDDEKSQSASTATLEEHLISHQHRHLVLLLKQTKSLNETVKTQQATIERMERREATRRRMVEYLESSGRIGRDNIWVLCGSHKFWKHKYNQLYTVNLRNECRFVLGVLFLEALSLSVNALKFNSSTL